MEEEKENEKTGLSPGFYVFGVSPDSDTLTIQRLNMVIKETKTQKQEEVKDPLCFKKNEIDLSAV